MKNIRFTRVHINALSISLALVVAGVVALLLGNESIAGSALGLAGGVALKLSDITNKQDNGNGHN